MAYTHPTRPARIPTRVPADDSGLGSNFAAWALFAFAGLMFVIALSGPGPTPAPTDGATPSTIEGLGGDSAGTTRAD